MAKDSFLAEELRVLDGINCGKQVVWIFVYEIEYQSEMVFGVHPDGEFGATS